jgi:hypothetical protein
MHSRTQTPLGYVVRAEIRHTLTHRYVAMRSSARLHHLLLLLPASLQGCGRGCNFPLEAAPGSVACPSRLCGYRPHHIWRLQRSPSKYCPGFHSTAAVGPLGSLPHISAYTCIRAARNGCDRMRMPAAYA